MTQISPLVSHFPMARWVAANPENAPVNSPASAIGNLVRGLHRAAAPKHLCRSVPGGVRQALID